MIINKSKANIILNCNLGFPIHTLKKHSSGKSGIKCTQGVTVDIFCPYRLATDLILLRLFLSMILVKLVGLIDSK